MDIAAVKAGLATAAGNVTSTPTLNALAYVPDSIPEPCFFPIDVSGEYDMTFNRGIDDLMFTCRILVSRTDDRASQALLDSYLKGSGTSSLKTAIETDRTLGGVCSSLQVKRFDGFRWYEHAGTKYLGAELTIRVVGSGA